MIYKKIILGYKSIFIFSLLILFSSCKKDDLNHDKVISTQKIWSDKNYSAFTDLIVYKNKWYCVFREAVSHVGSIGTLRIIESADGLIWKESSIIKMAGIDLRDPKFLIDQKGELILFSSTVDKISNQFINFFWTFNNDNSWSNPNDYGIYDVWLWRSKTYNNQIYTFGYRGETNRLSLFSFKSLKKGNEISVYNKNEIDLDGCPSEVAFTFMPDKRLVAIARRDCQDGNSFLGIASPPYNSFTWYDLGMIVQSPNLLLYNGIIYVAGRVYKPNDKTSIYTLNLNTNKLDFYTDLKSDLDTGYPGMLVKDNFLYISYYSSDGFDYRAIYLAKVKLKQ